MLHVFAVQSISFQVAFRSLGSPSCRQDRELKRSSCKAALGPQKRYERAELRVGQRRMMLHLGDL